MKPSPRPDAACSPTSAILSDARGFANARSPGDGAPPASQPPLRDGTQRGARPQWSAAMTFGGGTDRTPCPDEMPELSSHGGAGTSSRRRSVTNRRTRPAYRRREGPGEIPQAPHHVPTVCQEPDPGAGHLAPGHSHFGEAIAQPLGPRQQLQVKQVPRLPAQREKAEACRPAKHFEPALAVADRQPQRGPDNTRTQAAEPGPPRLPDRAPRPAAASRGRPPGRRLPRPPHAPAPARRRRKLSGHAADGGLPVCRHVQLSSCACGGGSLLFKRRGPVGCYPLGRKILHGVGADLGSRRPGTPLTCRRRQRGGPTRRRRGPWDPGDQQPSWPA
jgi:hypothetical protein